jgi:hypothetical protein
MKLRNREVNVFSMSALDLFASAMGAFMFLAIIALPFFPNTGSSPESISEIKKELDAAKEKTAQTEKALESTQKSLDEANKELAEGIDKYPIELIITIDISGSMAVPLQRLKDAIKRLTIEMPKVTREFKIGVVAYGGDGKFITVPSVVITKTSRERFIQQIDALELLPGETDVPEAVSNAMAMFSPPNDKVRKAYVLIGDVGPYEMIGSRSFDIYAISEAQANRLINAGRGVQVSKNYETEILNSIGSFISSNKLRSVMAMYTGNATRRGDASYNVIALTKPHSIPFFKAVANEGGEDNGHYSEEPSEMLSMLLIAVLAAS